MPIPATTQVATTSPESHADPRWRSSATGGAPPRRGAGPRRPRLAPRAPRLPPRAPAEPPVDQRVVAVILGPRRWGGPRLRQRYLQEQVTTRGEHPEDLREALLGVRYV